MTMASNWQTAPRRLWGDDWIAPLSEVLGINRRTIERWRAGEGEPHSGLQQELRQLASRSEARAIGTVLRRLSRGESLDDIQRDLLAMQAAVTQVATDVGKYVTIPTLSPKE